MASDFKEKVWKVRLKKLCEENWKAKMFMEKANGVFENMPQHVRQLFIDKIGFNKDNEKVKKYKPSPSGLNRKARR